MHPGQFPRHFHVARTIEVQVIEVMHEPQRPGLSRLEVGLPVDSRAEINATRAEKIDPVGQRRFGCGENAIAIAGAQALVHRLADRANDDRVQPPGHALPQAVER